MLADLRDFLLLTDAGWWVGTGLIVAGIVALAGFAWRHLGDVQVGPVPRKLADPPPRWLHRADSDTGVVPRIPGATPHAGPVCPVCGAAWHGPVCPPPKERTDETVQLPPVAALAPQFAALRRYLDAIDETAAVTDEALHRIVDKLADRADDCPLTTQEIEVTETAPLYVASGGTVDLSEKLKKVTA